MKRAPILIQIGLVAAGHAAEPQSPPPQAEEAYVTLTTQRLQEGMDFLKVKGWPSPDQNADFKQHMALLLLFNNEKVEEANRLVMEFCPFY